MVLKLMVMIRKFVAFFGEWGLSTAVSCWFQYASIEMAWAGRRPIVPDASSGDVIPINNHGIMYVSQADLSFQHYFILPGLLFGAVGLALRVFAHSMGHLSHSQHNGHLKRVGTIAEMAFIAFLPIWLFANPYLALAKAIPDRRWLLAADVATGLLWVGWFAVAQHGKFFKGGARRQALRN